METNYYEYVGTEEQACDYGPTFPVLGNIYPSDAIIGGKSVYFWIVDADGDKKCRNEWKQVKKEQSTKELIELLNKKAAKHGMTCSVTFELHHEVEITDFNLSKVYENGFTSVYFCVNLGILQVQKKETQLIEAIKRELEND
jgi:hypothetical protein